MKKQAISYFFYATFIFWALAITWICLADKLLIHKTLTFFQTNFLDVFFQVVKQPIGESAIFGIITNGKAQNLRFVIILFVFTIFMVFDFIFHLFTAEK